MFETLHDALSFNLASDADLKEIAREAVELKASKKRRLNRFKVEDGKRYQLHATRGWKCVGRVNA